MSAKALMLLGLLVAAGTYTAYNYETTSQVDRLTEQQEKQLQNIKFRQKVADFGEFKQQNGRKYKDDYEETYRLSLFVKNEEDIEAYNDNKESDDDVTLGVNEFSDMTDDEFGQSKFGLQQTGEEKDYVDDDSNSKLTQRNIATNLDFRHLGRNVRRQTCGDCWANAAAVVTEMNFSPWRLSIQDLIDCTDKLKYTGNGCSGATDLGKTLQHVIDNGIAFESYVPYKGREDQCKNVRRVDIPRKTRMTSFYDSYNAQCDNVKRMINDHGPLTIALYAEQSVHWKNYRYGIARHRSNESWVKNRWGGANINHAVVLVGYTPQYWIVQNSWGKTWGDNGYIKIAMGDTFNICHHAGAFVSANSRHKSPLYDNHSIAWRN